MVMTRAPPCSIATPPFSDQLLIDAASQRTGSARVVNGRMPGMAAVNLWQ